jgi:hypothetical protein
VEKFENKNNFSENKKVAKTKLAKLPSEALEDICSFNSTDIKIEDIVNHKTKEISVGNLMKFIKTFHSTINTSKRIRHIK